MSTEAYYIIAIVFGVVDLFGGFLMKILWDTLKGLRAENDRLSKELTELAKLVAGDYIKRAEFEKGIDRLYEKLEDVNEKIMVRFDGLSLEMKGKMDKNDYREKFLSPDR